MMSENSTIENNTKHNAILSVKGRIGRYSFLAWYFLLYLPFLVITILVVRMIENENEDDFINVTSGFAQSYATIEQEALWLDPLFLILILSFLIVNVIFLIRRLHDINLSGWFSLLIPLPVPLSIPLTYITPSVDFLFIRVGLLITLSFFLFLLVKKGTQGVNKYGSVRTTPKWEEIVGIIALLTIAASVIRIFMSS